MNKQTAALLFGHSYQLEDKEGRIWDIYNLGVSRSYIDGEPDEMHMDLIRNTQEGIKQEFLTIDQIGTDYFIRCRPISDLTKTIQHEGKEITPLQHMAEWKAGIVIDDVIGFTSNGSAHGMKYCDDDGDAMVFSYSDETKSFHWRFYKGDNRLVINQSGLFDTLYSLHFKPSQIPDEWVKWID
jgi:hypothetical protein